MLLDRRGDLRHHRSHQDDLRRHHQHRRDDRHRDRRCIRRHLQRQRHRDVDRDRLVADRGRLVADRDARLVPGVLADVGACCPG